MELAFVYGSMIILTLILVALVYGVISRICWTVSSHTIELPRHIGTDVLEELGIDYLNMVTSKNYVKLEEYKQRLMRELKCYSESELVSLEFFMDQVLMLIKWRYKEIYGFSFSPIYLEDTKIVTGVRVTFQGNIIHHKPSVLQ